jgi:hypothetical protein
MRDKMKDDNGRVTDNSHLNEKGLVSDSSRNYDSIPRVEVETHPPKNNNEKR